MIEAFKSLFGTSKGYYKRMQRKGKQPCHSSWGFRIMLFVLANIVAELSASPLPAAVYDSDLRRLQRIESALGDDSMSVLLGQEGQQHSRSSGVHHPQQQNVNIASQLGEGSSAFPLASVVDTNDNDNDKIKNNQENSQTGKNNNNNNKTNVQAQALLSTDDDGGSSSYLNSFHKVKMPSKHQYKPKTVLVGNGSGKRKIFRADKSMQRVEKKSWKIPIKSVGLYSENSKDAHAPQRLMDELTQIFDTFKDS